MLLQGVVGFFRLLLEGTSGAVRGFFLLPFKVKFGLIHLLLVLTLLFNAQSWFGENAAAQTGVLLLYLVSVAFAFINTGRPNPLVRISTAEFLITFAVWSIVGIVLFKLFSPVTPPIAELTTTAIGVLLMHAFVVAVGEELLFRYAIPSMIPGPAMVAQGISAVLFGLLHWTAYGGAWLPILWAMFLGLVFGAVTVRFRNGLIIAIALHLAWNASTLGFT